jgi:hypothetical protein
LAHYSEFEIFFLADIFINSKLHGLFFGSYFRSPTTGEFVTGAPVHKINATILEHHKPKYSAAFIIFLNWRTRYRAIRAVNAAVAGFGFQNCMAILTLIKELACIRGHSFKLTVSTNRAGNYGSGNNFFCHLNLSR